MAKTKPKPSISTLIERLNEKHPDAKYELNWETPLELLIATILAAQCTDVRVNKVTEDLFVKYPNAKAYANAKLSELEEDVKPTGFYRNKAKAIQNACKALVSNFEGEVPKTMPEMLTLPGVARKTANVVLNTAFKIPTGIIVDSHVARVSQRLGIVKESKPEKIEYELMKIVPKDEWIQFGPALVLHGRYTCTNSKPKCDDCIYDDICPKQGVPVEKPKEKTKPKEKKPMAKKASTRKAKVNDYGTHIKVELPSDWHKVLKDELNQDYFKNLEKFVADERKSQTIFPPEEEVFSAFSVTPFKKVKVLLLGQDPYHGPGQAHGMCFSVKPGVPAPPSLKNMYKELKADLGHDAPDHGYLESWAKQGVMLLNAVLTVRQASPNSHKDKGWEQFTDAVIRALNDRDDPVVFLLWGGYARKKVKLIDESKHVIIESAHPSPLSVKKFLGSKPYSKVNAALKEMGKDEIDWQIPKL